MHNSGSISQYKNNQAQLYSHEAERILIQETLSLLEQIKFLPSTSVYLHPIYTSFGSVLFKRPD